MIAALVRYTAYKRAMKASADVCIVPIGVGVSLLAYIAECERVFQKAGLTVQIAWNGTNIEGRLGCGHGCHQAVP